VRSRLLATALWAVSGAVAVVAAIIVVIARGEDSGVGVVVASAVVVAGVLGFVAGVRLYRSNSQ
jgi:hypothetical protein